MKGRGRRNHAAVPQPPGQPSRVLWREGCPSEPFFPHFAKSPGKHITWSKWPKGAGSWRLSANLTPTHGQQVHPQWGQAVTPSYLPHSPCPSNHRALSFPAPQNLSHLPLFLHPTCQHLDEGPDPFSLVTETASQLFSLTPFCPLLPRGQRDLYKYPHPITSLPGSGLPPRLSSVFLMKFRQLRLECNACSVLTPLSSLICLPTPGLAPPQLVFQCTQPFWQSPALLGLCSRCYLSKTSTCGPPAYDWSPES